MIKLSHVSYAALSLCLISNVASANTNKRIQNLENELNSIKKLYEQRISELEDNKSTIYQFEDDAKRSIYDNKLNPSIGVVLNGQYATYSEAESEFVGFAIGEEGERGEEGFKINESELNFSSNIDDKFYGSVTLAVVTEEGSDKVELEEAFILSNPGLGLPTGMSFKAGRAFWKFGYLNEHHAHSDDFADRPLPYRAFLNKGYNDDGVQLSYVLATDLYQEVGGGLFRGYDFPFGDGDGNSNYSVYYRLGSDIGNNQDWRIGAYALKGSAVSRETEEGDDTFVGESDLYAIDFKYSLAPTQNAKNQELTFQAEYFKREEDGTYDMNGTSGAVDNDSSGWYAQLVYKFKPKWRVGFRYSELSAATTPTSLNSTNLNANGFDPVSHSAMVDWTNSEFSRVRFQYNLDELSDGADDNQFILQYIVSFGAHTAHKY
jgi:hypothetical protein